MATLSFEKEITALLLVDPYNDFISEGGKIWAESKALPKQTTAFLTCCGFCKRRGE
jgi:ureidoacrylate peracid hydrolase